MAPRIVPLVALVVLASSLGVPSAEAYHEGEEIWSETWTIDGVLRDSEFVEVGPAPSDKPLFCYVRLLHVDGAGAWRASLFDSTNRLVRVDNAAWASPYKAQLTVPTSPTVFTGTWTFRVQATGFGDFAETAFYWTPQGGCVH